MRGRGLVQVVKFVPDRQIMGMNKQLGLGMGTSHPPSPSIKGGEKTACTSHNDSLIAQLSLVNKNV